MCLDYDEKLMYLSRVLVRRHKRRVEELARETSKDVERAFSESSWCLTAEARPTTRLQQLLTLLMQEYQELFSHSVLDFILEKQETERG